MVDHLRPNVLGWKAYFRLAQTPKVWRELDQWLRDRLRAIQLKQWKCGTTMYRELLALGAKRDVARQVAANCRRWWCNSGMLLNAVLTLKWSDRLGLPLSHDLNFLNRPVRTRMPGGVAGERPKRSPPMPIVRGPELTLGRGTNRSVVA